MTRRRRTLGGALCFVLAGLFVAGQGHAAVGAEDDLSAERLGLSVEAGYDGLAVRRAWIPVSVSMEPDHAFEGQLRVLVNHSAGRQVTIEDVEVPAGSAKVFRFVVPPSETVEVQAVPRDGEGVSVRGRVEETTDYLVGVIGEGVPANAPPFRSYATDDRGRYVAVDPTWLDHPNALASLSAVVAGDRTLDGLSEDQRRNLAAEVVSGLDLVVVADAPGTVDLDPFGLVSPAAAVGTDPGLTDTLALEPADGTWTLTSGDVLDEGADVPVAVAGGVGLGRIIVSGAALGVGPVGAEGDYWSQLLEPTARSGGTVATDGMPSLLSHVAEGLRTTQLELPSLGWFAVFLLAYLVVVGPVNGLVLWRAGRRELAWVTVPAVTIVFAAGAWITSADQSTSLGITGRATYWIDGHGSEVTATAVRAPRADEHRVVLDGSGWSILSGNWSSAANVRTTPDAVTLDLRLEALQVGTVIAQRPAPPEPPLAVAARVVDDTVEVEVTNRSDSEVAGVRVRAGTAEDGIGTLTPGETVSHRFEAGGTLPIVEAWHDPFAGAPVRDGGVEAPASLETLLRFSVLDGNPGLVWVTGTLAPGDDDVPVSVGGSVASDQGSFVAVGATPDQTDRHLSPFEVGRQLITSGFGSVHRPGPLAIEGQTEAVLRYRLPANGEVVELTSSLERGQLETGMGEVHACQAAEVLGDGRMTREVCGPEPLLPLIDEACPDDATHCALEEGSLFVCLEDGPCQGQPIPDAVADAMADAHLEPSGLEIYDRAERAWVPIRDVFEDGVTHDPDPYVSPLGEVFVRVSGEMFPFDYSGRGIGGRFAS